MKHEIDLPEMIRVMQAAKDGSRIECADLPYSDDSVDEDLNWDYVGTPCWDWNSYRYREEETAPASLLDRIKAEYAEHDVVELEWDKRGLWTMKGYGCYDAAYLHTTAQSMKGFDRYVYSDDDGLFLRFEAVIDNHDEALHPVAVLFTK